MVRKNSPLSDTFLFYYLCLGLGRYCIHIYIYYVVLLYLYVIFLEVRLGFPEIAPELSVIHELGGAEV